MKQIVQQIVLPSIPKKQGGKEDGKDCCYLALRSASRSPLAIFNTCLCFSRNNWVKPPLSCCFWTKKTWHELLFLVACFLRTQEGIFCFRLWWCASQLSAMHVTYKRSPSMRESILSLTRSLLLFSFYIWFIWPFPPFHCQSLVFIALLLNPAI